MQSDVAYAYFDNALTFYGPIEKIWFPLASFLDGPDMPNQGLYHIANYEPYLRPHANGMQYRDVYQRPALHKLNFLLN